MIYTMLGSLVGGIGLFMLGMKLMTDGMKLAAGHTLRDILNRSTGTPLRGIFSGAFITSLVQSSGAVTVAIIGFVNAGLMNLKQAITIIYGSNIGTTMTGWLVVLVGFQVDIKSFALPAVGLGMLLRLSRGTNRQGALGEALAGIGVFFIGIDILKSTFSGLSGTIHFSSIAGIGAVGVLVFVGIGFLLTFFMQSSSAAIAIVLTATAGGVIPLSDAAAAVIGANIGSTSTAALAVIGATPNAKRVAAAHVAFNLLTGGVALLMLFLLPWSFISLRLPSDLHFAPSTLLAMFHTSFNVLGVILMWPCTKALVKFLKTRFRSAEEDESRPVYLDQNIVGTPVLAMHALANELGRVGTIARRMACGALSSESGPGKQLEKDKTVLLKLEAAIAEFVNLMQRGNLPHELDDMLPNALRVSGYYREVAEVADSIANQQKAVHLLDHPELSEQIAHFRSRVVNFLQAVDAAAKDYSPQEYEKEMQLLMDEYHLLKSHLLRAGTRNEIPVGQMVYLLETNSEIRRIIDQAEKGARYLSTLTSSPPVSAELEAAAKEKA